MIFNAISNVSYRKRFHMVDDIKFSPFSIFEIRGYPWLGFCVDHLSNSDGHTSSEHFVILTSPDIVDVYKSNNNNNGKLESLFPKKDVLLRIHSECFLGDNTLMSNRILQLPLDRSKRHFVVGDIHGRFDSFQNLLKEANYDPTNDIIYSVGDLIDRGPKSYETVKFFTSTPNVYSIMGNHEYMA